MKATGSTFDRAKGWLLAEPCVSLRTDGSLCKKTVTGQNVRCSSCWIEFATSSNGLLRVRAATEVGRVRGVTTEAFARFANDPVTAVRLAVIENATGLSSGWQLHMANDPEAIVWRALASRRDLCNQAAFQLLSRNDDPTLGFMIANPMCPVSVVRWVANNKAGQLSDAAKRALAEPFVKKQTAPRKIPDENVNRAG